jgi:hypothetical protein
MKQIQLAISIVQRIVGDKIEVLLQLDPHRQSWCFVVGQRLQTESFRETILRETAWRLDLDRKKDFLVAHMPLLSVEHVERPPHSEDDAKFKLEFYPVHLYGHRSVQKVSQSSACDWFSCREVCSGLTNQGMPVDPQIVNWLNKWQILHPWN